MDRYRHENREKSKELFRKRFELNQELENLEFETQKLISRQNNGINMRVPDALSTVIGLANDLTNQTADLPESDSANQKFPGNLNRNQMQDIVELLSPWLKHVEDEHSKLKKKMSDCRQERRGLYDFEDFKKYDYILNGVIIHQGQVGAGHYWAYIKLGYHNRLVSFFSQNRVRQLQTLNLSL